jgi:hypothetical protein
LDGADTQRKLVLKCEVNTPPERVSAPSSALSQDVLYAVQNVNLRNAAVTKNALQFAAPDVDEGRSRHSMARSKLDATSSP